MQISQDNHIGKIIFNQKLNSHQQSKSLQKWNEDILNKSKDDIKKQSTNKKIFSVQQSKFMLTRSGNYQNNTNIYSIDPLTKLNNQINIIEDMITKTQKINIRKLKNIGKRYNKQSEREIKLREQIMQLKNELKKNIKIINDIKIQINQQNSQYFDDKQNLKYSSKITRSHQSLFSVFKNNKCSSVKTNSIN